MSLERNLDALSWNFLKIMGSETPWLRERAMHGTWGIPNGLLRASILELSLRWGWRMFEGNVTVIAFDLGKLILLDFSRGSEFFGAKWGRGLLIFEWRGRSERRVNDARVGSWEMRLLRNVCENKVRRLVHFFDFLLNLKLLEASHHYYITNTLLEADCLLHSALLLAHILRSRKR